MKEIGSEFWTGCTPTTGHDYSMRPEIFYKTHPSRVVETLSGRTALEHIVEVLVRMGKTAVCVPSFCCQTMIVPFLKHGMKVLFYDVQITQKGLHRVTCDKKYDTILLMDYFGHTDDETLEIATREKADGVTVIYDATHSMYSLINTQPYDFVYGSYRKWLDINCGFFSWGKEQRIAGITQSDGNQAYARVREELFDRKAEYMNGGAVRKEAFLSLINTAEFILEEHYHHKMPDDRSKEVLKHSDANYIINKRRTNAKVLTDAINELNDARVRCINPVLNPYDTPLFVGVIVESTLRDPLRRFLIEHEIYCPIHWPKTKEHIEMRGSKLLFNSELSLICDQRYDEKDMHRISETITDFLKS